MGFKTQSSYIPVEGRELLPAHWRPKPRTHERPKTNNPFCFNKTTPKNRSCMSGFPQATSHHPPKSGIMRNEPKPLMMSGPFDRNKGVSQKTPLMIERFGFERYESPRNLDARLPAHQGIAAAFDHEAGPAAVHVLVAQPVRGAIVDQDRAAASHRNPGIRSAAKGMNSRIPYPQRRTAIDQRIGRPSLGWANAHVRAVPFKVCIRRYQRLIAEPGLRLHRSLSVNIARSGAGLS
jgi:hypothetical protein